MSDLQAAIKAIESVANDYCESQVYCFDDYDAENFDATALCKRLQIPFTDDLLVRYLTCRTFSHIPCTAILEEERLLGATLPDDYKILLETFGEFHLPGRGDVHLKRPTTAGRFTEQAWSLTPPLPAIAISTYNNTSDGNSVGFLRNGTEFGPELFEFNHELRWEGDDPKLWATQIAPSLARFIVEHLRRRY